MLSKPVNYNNYNILFDKGSSISFEHNNIKYNLYSQNQNCGLKFSEMIEFTVDEILDNAFFEKLETNLKKKKIKNFYFRLHPLSTISEKKKIEKFLTEKNYIFNFQKTLILRLNDSIIDLKKNLRKSYKSLINREIKKIKFLNINTNENKFFFFDTWLKIYSKAISRGSKKIPNTAKEALLKSFNKYEIEIFLAYEKDDIEFRNVLGGMLFSKKNDYAYYSLSANSNLIEKSNFRAIGHSIMWYAIEYLKNNGVKFIDFGTILTSESDKINNINKFKLGFGGDLIETIFFEKKFK